MMGRIVSTLSLTRLQKYSLFQKYKARSATCKKSRDISIWDINYTFDGTNLEVRAGNRFGQLVEKRFLYFGELGWVHDLKDVLDFVKVHDFFGTIGLWPVTQQSKDNIFGQG